MRSHAQLTTSSKATVKVPSQIHPTLRSSGLSVQRYNESVAVDSKTQCALSHGEVITEGKRLYAANRFEDAARIFEIDLARVEAEAQLSAYSQLLRHLPRLAKDDPLLDSYLQNEISVLGWYFIVKRKAVAELLAELKDFEVRMNGREPGMLLRRTRARGAAVSMGGAVIVVERLDGDGTLPEHAPAATAFEKLAASRSKLGRRFGENVFHIASAGGTLDFEMGVVTRAELQSKLSMLGAKKHNSFEGTVVVSAEAARSGIDFDKAFPRAFVVYDPGVAEAVAGMVVLRKPPPRQSAATVAILLPRTATQQHTMGLDSWTQGQRTEAWRSVTAWARTAHVGAVVTWQRDGFNPLTAIRRMWTKLTDRELVIKALLESQSVLDSVRPRHPPLHRASRRDETHGRRGPQS